MESLSVQFLEDFEGANINVAVRSGSTVFTGKRNSENSCEPAYWIIISP